VLGAGFQNRAVTLPFAPAIPTFGRHATMEKPMALLIHGICQNPALACGVRIVIGGGYSSTQSVALATAPPRMRSVARDRIVRERGKAAGAGALNWVARR
jgi:hypothetical protein